MTDETYYAHPSAVIDAGATIGADTRIWHFCHVMAGAEIGPGCTLGQNVFVAGGVVLGRGCKVQNNVSLYTGVVCEDEVFLGPSCVLTNVLNPRAGIERKDQFRTTRIGRGATVGANATVVCGVTLGAYCLVGAGAVVTRDVPAYGLVVGTPARQVGWVSRAGHRLALDGAGRATCPETGEGYQLHNGLLRPLA
ncbi:MAG: acyltransferase [Bacteroidia bacterium]|nr:acyltransferase [Bacteroidia bacterium]